MNKRLITAAAVLAVAAMALTACSTAATPAATPKATAKASKYDAATISALGGDANATYLDKLYQKAIAAGQKTITVYGVTATSSASLYAAFSLRYPGITVNHVTIFGAELQSRIASEQATSQYVADNVSVSGADAAYVTDNKFIAKTEVPAASKLDKQYKVGDTLYGGNTYLYTVGYNSNLVKSGDVPTTFKDLLLPKWKGKIGMISPAGGVSSFLSGALAHGKITEKWLTSFEATQPVMFASERDMFTALSTGQLAMGLGNYVRGDAFLKVDSLPVKFVTDFADGVGDGVFYRGTVKNAPHPLASDLLVNWWLTPEAQTLIAAQGQPGLMPGSPAVPGQPALADIKVNHGPTFADLSAYTAKYAALFKKVFVN
ncbi:MAG: iron(III) transport system substrate-binding protein [Microbacteriaceae bacterium]|nr:iron(III) transport system substrate-binding protein [Microbacteriaceae bacterium]